MNIYELYETDRVYYWEQFQVWLDQFPDVWDREQAFTEFMQEELQEYQRKQLEIEYE